MSLVHMMWLFKQTLILNFNYSYRHLSYIILVLDQMLFIYEELYQICFIVLAVIQNMIDSLSKYKYVVMGKFIIQFPNFSPYLDFKTNHRNFWRLI